MGVCKWVGVLAAMAVVALAIGARVLRNSDQATKLQVAVNLFGWDGIMHVVRESVANRLVGTKQTQARVAYEELLDTLSEVGQQYLSPERAITDTDDVAEGITYITHVLGAGFNFHMESDVLLPRFTSMVNPNRKLLGDNPDALYMIANLDIDEAYVVTGRPIGEDYLSFTLAEAPCQGCFSNQVIADVNIFDVALEADGSFVVHISKDEPSPPVANWLPLRPTNSSMSVQVITRHYFETEVSVQTNGRVVADVAIAFAPGPHKRPTNTYPRDDAEVAKRLKKVDAFVRGLTVGINTDVKTVPKWFSFELNVFGPPQSFRQEGSKSSDGGGGLGAVDIVCTCVCSRCLALYCVARLYSEGRGGRGGAGGWTGALELAWHRTLSPLIPDCRLLTRPCES